MGDGPRITAKLDWLMPKADDKGERFTGGSATADVGGEPMRLHLRARGAAVGSLEASFGDSLDLIREGTGPARTGTAGLPPKDGVPFAATMTGNRYGRAPDGRSTAGGILAAEIDGKKVDFVFGVVGPDADRVRAMEAAHWKEAREAETRSVPLGVGPGRRAGRMAMRRAPGRGR